MAPLGFEHQLFQLLETFRGTPQHHQIRDLIRTWRSLRLDCGDELFAVQGLISHVVDRWDTERPWRFGDPNWLENDDEPEEPTSS